MSDHRDRFNKVIALAVNPGAYEDEAIAALKKARDLVAKDPSLAHPPPPAPPPRPNPAPHPEASFQARLTKLPPTWLYNVINSLSQEAYGLGLKSKLVVDFNELPYALDIRCDGSAVACRVFENHVSWLINFINSQPRTP
jgi:hypothetical protein